MTAMLRRFVLLLNLLACASPAAAETVFVNDALYLGLHQDNTLSSTIIELIPSGTELELLAREDNLLQVRTLTGITGWVDAGYISEQAPGRAQIAILEAKLQDSTDRIAVLEEELTQAGQREEDTANQLEQALKAQPIPEPTPPPDPPPIPSSTLREMQTLAEENQRLKQQVAELEAMQVMAVEQAQAAESALKLVQDKNPELAPAATTEAAEDEGLKITRLKYWQQLLLGSILMFAFALGGWLVDLSVRHRHGGHRL